MYNIRVGYGCGIKATLLTASGEVCDLRRARYKGALLVLPNGSTIPCADVSVDDVTNAMYVRLLADRELTTTGKYGILFNVKMANGVMYSSPVIMFAEVSDNAEVEYKELNISFAVTVTYLPANVAYTGASPKISPNGTWLVFNDDINAYEDTGEPASYAGLLGDIQEVREELSSKTTPLFITENTTVDWKTIGKNSKGELCVIGGDSEVADYLDGYLSVNGYVKDEDVAATYASRKWVESKKYITFEDVPLTLKSYVNDAGYITLEAIAPYAKKADTLGGYGITNAYTKSEVDSAIFGALLPEKITPSILIDDITIKRKADGTLYAVGGAGGGGGSIAYPLTWSGYSSGSYDGSVSKNIAIPSLLSQLTNDAGFATSAAVSAMLSDYATKDFVTSKGYITSSALTPYITTESVNSLLTDYLPKSGGAVSGDITVTAGKISAPYFLALGIVSVNGGERDCMNITTSSAYPAIVMKGANHSGEVRLYNRGGTEWMLTDEGWGNTYSILHSGNYSEYALPITGGSVSGAVTINHNGNTPLVINQNYGTASNPRGVIVMNSSLSNNNLYISHLFGKEGSTRNSAWVGFYLDSASSNNNRLSMGLYGVDNVLNVLGSGNVAIGGTTASAKLHVHGNLLVAGEITQNSSLVLKDIQGTRYLSIEELEQLKPYNFYWKDGRDNKLHAGAVADEVKQLLPEVISTDKDGILSMNYANAAWIVGTSLTPYVTKHEAEIAELKARIKELKDKLNLS